MDRLPKHLVLKANNAYVHSIYKIIANRSAIISLVAESIPTFAPYQKKNKRRSNIQEQETPERILEHRSEAEGLPGLHRSRQTALAEQGNQFQINQVTLPKGQCGTMWRGLP